MKQKLVATVLGLLIVFSAFAVNKDDITMVSYEQSWHDYRGTLALKNNTNEDIHNVVFQIIYMDMSGNQLDYKDFTKEVSIAPGMAKKVNIPAYESGRNYHYYKSESLPVGSPSFKIKFKLKDYNVAKSEKVTNDDQGKVYENSNYYRYYSLLTIIVVLAFIGITIGLYVLVAVMAQKRNRSVALWVLLSIFASPILAIVSLLVVGDSNKQLYD